MGTKEKKNALYWFQRTPLKHPMSKFLLQSLADNDNLLKRTTFVDNRDHLSNTMQVSELGSPRVGFELELGGRTIEEVSIVNGTLVKHCKRTHELCTNEPMEAIVPLQEFKGRLYVCFRFCSPTPEWYRKVAEPNPYLPTQAPQEPQPQQPPATIEQVDRAIRIVMAKAAIERALLDRNEAEFKRYRAELKALEG